MLELLCCYVGLRAYSKSSLTLTEWRFNLSFSWVSMLFLNSWRASVMPYSVTTHPPAIQKLQHWHSREAQTEPPLIECEGARGQAPQLFKSALLPGTKCPLPPEKCRLDCIFCPIAFDFWLHLFLYFGMSWKILLFPGKITICPKKFCHFREKYDISGKFFGVLEKF
jgi:hypothetical protein